jgi:tripartite-type tricarboxylate transporter receptor subunit TctC
VGAPTGTPVAIIATLNKEIRAALADPTLKARIEELGGIPLSMSPEEFGKFLANETEKMARVIKAAGISVK